MHVGYSAIFQNPEDQLSDHEVYQNELRLATLAEPLGFESVWSVEHHFTDYTMVPDVIQFLTYMAGKTEKIKLGSMVVVLPWHDPLRVAEQVAMLDNISDGRMIFGVGRGLGRIEYGGVRQNMDESREIFDEYAEIIVDALEKGYSEYDGHYVKQPRRDLRPRPFKSFKGRTYAAAVSPNSLPSIAKQGIGILIIPQKPWSEVDKDLTAYRQFYRDLNKAEAPPPLCAGWIFVDKDPERAEELARKYIGQYYQSVLKHYEFSAGHLKTTKGYEYYGGVTEHLEKYGSQAAIDFFVDLMPWGTPEQVYEKIINVHDKVGNDGFMGVFSYSGMPWNEAERNMRLFADEVMPELQKFETISPVFAKSA